MSYNWSSITGSETRGLIGSTVSSNDIPYFCGTNADNYAYVTQLVNKTITNLFESTVENSIYTSMQLVGEHFLLAGFAPNGHGYGYLADANLIKEEYSGWVDSNTSRFYAIKFKNVFIAVGQSGDNAYIVKTNLRLTTTPVVYYNSNLVANNLTGVEILSDETIISVGENNSGNGVIFANGGQNPYTFEHGIFYSVALDSNDNIYACGTGTNLEYYYGVVQKFTYSSATGFTLIKTYTDNSTNNTFYTSISSVKNQIYISGGNGNSKNNCNPYILKFDNNLNINIKYIGLQDINLIDGVIKINSISVDSKGTIYSIYMKVSESKPSQPILLVGVSSGFVIYRQLSGNLSEQSLEYTLDNLTEYTNGCFYDITKDDKYLYAVGSGYLIDSLFLTPVIYRQPIDDLGGGGELYALAGLDLDTIFTSVQIDSLYIYGAGFIFTKDGLYGILYRQPINNLTEQGQLYNNTSKFFFTKLQINSEYIYLSGGENAGLFRQPIDNLSEGLQQYIINGDTLNFINLAIDSQYITLVGSFTTTTTTNVFGLIYRQPIDNLLGGGKKYTLTGLDKYTDVQFSDLKINNGFIYACGFSLLDNLPYGIVYKQSIDQKYANPFLQQDSNLSILNAGNEILKQSIDLLITYIET